ncbi:large ribosomal subunit protein mL64 [Stomoxys calcitrans]|uniref:Large ribosomal subunit protein mL64 n=1 Tax=Stomoxys calcitrans TaxID=35570 RepID=A0A1I8P6F7_STOCA|nr:large ribosomal subunit protein mL64 [Stomoxys calcitrans]
MAGLFVRNNFDKKVVNYICSRHLFSSNSVSTSGYEYNYTDSVDQDVQINRNKSGLLLQHRNMLYERPSYKKPSSWIHLSEKYQRKVFSRCGLESGIDPRICFLKKSDLNSQKNYEAVSEPENIFCMMEKSKSKDKQKRDVVLEREEFIIKNMGKLEHWKKDLQNRIKKKEEAALAAKQRKERLVEEVRRHFGFKVDPRDEQFKEVLEQKEREDKKMQKEAKRKAKEQKLLSKLVENT